MTGTGNRLDFRGWFVFALLLMLLPGGVAWGQTSGDSRPVGEARVPALPGVSGLLQVPSAYVQRAGQAAVFVGGTSASTAGGALLGIADRIEIGLGARDTDSAGTDTMLNAKLALLPEQLLAPALSVGVLDLSDEDRSGYVTVSKYVIPYFTEALTGQPLAVKLHLGYGGGFYRHRVFAGAELLGAGGFSGIAETVSGHVSVGGRYYRRGFAATIGWLDLDRVGGSISYDILR